MRRTSLSQPNAQAFVPADTVAVAVLTAAAASAFDKPTGATHLRLSGVTTAGAAFGFAANIGSTKAQWAGASASAATASSRQNAVIPPGRSAVFQLLGECTGISLISGTSGMVSMEFWGST